MPTLTLHRIRKQFKLHLEAQKTWLAKAVPKNKNTAEGNSVPEDKLYHMK